MVSSAFGMEGPITSLVSKLKMPIPQESEELMVFQLQDALQQQDQQMVGTA